MTTCPVISVVSVMVWSVTMCSIVSVASVMVRSDSDVLKMSSCRRSMSSPVHEAQDDSVLDIIKLQRSESTRLAFIYTC